MCCFFCIICKILHIYSEHVALQSSTLLHHSLQPILIKSLIILMSCMSCVSLPLWGFPFISEHNKLLFIPESHTKILFSSHLMLDLKSFNTRLNFWHISKRLSWDCDILFGSHVMALLYILFQTDYSFKHFFSMNKEI